MEGDVGPVRDHPCRAIPGGRTDADASAERVVAIPGLILVCADELSRGVVEPSPHRRALAGPVEHRQLVAVVIVEVVDDRRACVVPHLDGLIPIRRDGVHRRVVAPDSGAVPDGVVVIARDRRRGPLRDIDVGHERAPFVGSHGKVVPGRRDASLAVVFLAEEVAVSVVGLPRLT
jgi:hypothetical protein